MRKTSKQGLLVLSVLCLLFAVQAVDADLDLGPFFSRDETLDGATRTRVLGPFLEWQNSDDGKKFMAFRPFYSNVDDPVKDRSSKHYLWPVGRSKVDDGKGDWQVFFMYGHDEDVSQSGSRSRFIVLPIFFAGRDRQDEGYIGFFPLGGKVNEFLGRDQIRFALFPLYMYSIVNDIETYDYLWPFISRTKGGDVSRFRVFPFYGQSKTGKRTNRFVMWPIWNSVRYEGSKNKGGGFILFPLYAHGKMNNDEMWMILPPFFKYAKNAKQKTLNCPYPLFQYGSGEINKLYIFPLWGKKSMPRAKSSFFLWPIFRMGKIEHADSVATRFRMVPLIHYGAITEKKVQVAGAAAVKDKKARSRYFKFWPLLSYRREGDVARFRMLDLYPAKDAAPIDRNYSPLWTLYSRHRNGIAREEELLWGIYRRQNDGEGSKSISVFPLYSSSKSVKDDGGRSWRFLLGLFGYERDGLKKTYRFLYLPIYRTNAGAEE